MYYGCLYAGTEKIADELMEIIHSFTPPNVTYIQYKNLVSISSKNGESLKSVLGFLKDIINRTDEALIKESKVGWLQDFLINKELLGSQVLSTGAGDACNNIEDVKELYKTKNEDNLKRSTYLAKIAQINDAVSDLSFDQEFQCIIDYMLAAFSGHSEDDLTEVLLLIKRVLINDLKAQSACLVKSSSASEERIAVRDYVNSRCEDNAGDFTWSHFDPSVHDDFNAIDKHEYWERMGATVSELLSSRLPMLKANHLDVLLEDEDAEIPTPPKFKGLDLDSGRSFSFAERVHPKNLRYDVQEQGYPWIDVLSGAIVAHYHMFVEAKQSESVRQQVIAFSDSLVDTPNVILADKIVEIYKIAQEITQ
jgi:hypothetical protein